MKVVTYTGRKAFLTPTQIAFLLSLFLLLLSGCSSGQQAVTLGAETMLPAFLNTATPRVRDAYHFAVANPSALVQIPCYCGCGKMGHASNLSCYINSDSTEDAIIYDEHADGCGICVDITQDVMRLTRSGQTTWEIRAYVDAQYSPFGPSTDTPLPAKP